MGDENVLSQGEITSVSTIENLIRLYAWRGIKFRDEKEFLDQVKSDWKKEQMGLLAECTERIEKGDFLPAELPSMHLSLGGKEYHLFGVVHGSFMSLYYGALVSYAINQHENLLFEQNLQIRFPGLKRYNELFDHLMIAKASFFKEGVIESLYALYAPFAFLRDKLKAKQKLYSHSISDLDEIAESFPFQADLLKKFIIENSGGFGIDPDKFISGGQNLDIDRPLYDELSLLLPLHSTFEKLPAYVVIQLNEKNNKAYTKCQRRSAYQAEFLRAWPVDGPKAILTGAGHSQEISYFLMNGVKDSRVIDMANAHALLLHEDREKYHASMKQNFAGHELASTEGNILGGMIQGCLIYYLLQGLFKH